MSEKMKLGTGKIWSLVLGLAIPAMLGQFVNVVYSVVDRMYIGNIPGNGELLLAAVGVCAPILTLITSFAALIGIGGSPMLSMKLGEKKEQEAQKILNNAFLMLAILSLFLTGLVLLIKKPLLFMFGASDVILPYADSYLTVYALGTLFAIMSAGLNYYIVCQGFATWAMLIVISGTIGNIVLDPIFIFTFDMGIQGAAIATVIAQMLSTVLSVWFLHGKKTILKVQYRYYSIKTTKRILKFGFCPFIILATDSIILIVLNKVLQQYGGDRFVASATIAQSFFLLISMPMLGISTGTQTILSFNYGARKMERVVKSEKCILSCCIAFTFFMFIVSRVFSEDFARIFTTDADMVLLASQQIQILTIGIMPLAFQYAFVDGLTGLGAVRVSVTLSLIRKSTYLALILLLPILFGAKAAFYAEPVADILCAVITSFTFLHIFPKILKKAQ